MNFGKLNPFKKRPQSSTIQHSLSVHQNDSSQQELNQQDLNQQEETVKLQEEYQKVTKNGLKVARKEEALRLQQLKQERKAAQAQKKLEYRDEKDRLKQERKLQLVQNKAEQAGQEKPIERHTLKLTWALLVSSVVGTSTTVLIGTGAGEAVLTFIRGLF